MIQQPSYFGRLRSSYGNQTPIVSNSQLQNQVIQFQQYQYNPTSYHPNNSINAQQNYHFPSSNQIYQNNQSHLQSSSLQHSNTLNQDNNDAQIQPLSNDISTSSQQSKNHQLQYLQQIQILTNKIIILQQRLFYFQDYNKKLLNQWSRSKDTLQAHQKEIQKMKSIIRKNQQINQTQLQKIQFLSNKVLNIEKQTLKNIEKHKTNQIDKQLTKKYNKALFINKKLQQQLSDAEKKIVQLQKQLQRNTCSNFYQNVTRLKQTIFKPRQSINHQQNQSIFNTINERWLHDNKQKSNFTINNQRNNISLSKKQNIKYK